MSDLSYLDDLSNKELHRKCLEHGLPNIPVTDSSRKVLVRKLRSAILGTPMSKKTAAAKKSSRRETVHSNKPTRAAAMSESPIRNQNNNIRNVISNQSRHTISTATPYEYESSSSMRTVETTTTVSDVGSQSEEDDNDQYVSSPKYSYSVQINPKQQDLRRSIPLSKSGVLTTSYVREIDQAHDDVDVPQSHTYVRPRVAPTVRFEPEIERTYQSNYASNPVSSSAQLGLSKTHLSSSSYLENTGYNRPTNSFTGSAAPFGFDPVSESLLRQRPPLGSSTARGLLINPTTVANPLYPKLDEFYNPPTVQNAPEPMDTDSETEYEPEVRHRPRHTTYQNQFSNRSQQQRRSPLPRAHIRNAYTPNDSLTDQFKVAMSSLDRKYHLKRYLFLVLTVMLVVFVYVLMSPST